MKISIIVLCYESETTKIIATLSSIVSQKYSNIELLISDDGSRNSKLKKDIIEKFLHSKGFHDYKIMEHERNVGTVNNLYMALKQCSGDIIKPIGPGDVFFSPFILDKIAGISDFNTDTIYFGELVSYYIDVENDLIHHHFKAPRNIHCYTKNNKILTVQEQFYDDNWLSGSTIFYGVNAINSLLARIKDFVRYAEDLSVALHILDDNPVVFLELPVVYYEYGSGISTGGRMTHALSNDHKKFKRYILGNFYYEFPFSLSAFLFATSGLWTPQLIDRLVKRLFVYLINGFSYTPARQLERRVHLHSMSYLAENISEARKFLSSEADL